MAPLHCALSVFAQEATLPLPPAAPALPEEGASMRQGSSQPENQDPVQNGSDAEENMFLTTRGLVVGRL